MRIDSLYFLGLIALMMLPERAYAGDPRINTTADLLSKCVSAYRPTSSLSHDELDDLNLCITYVKGVTDARQTMVADRKPAGSCAQPEFPISAVFAFVGWATSTEGITQTGAA